LFHHNPLYLTQMIKTTLDKKNKIKKPR